MKLLNKIALYFILFIFIGCSKNTQNNHIVVLDGVSIIDGTGNNLKPSMSIIIKNDTIMNIFEEGDFDYPANAKIIKLHNKYVIPGLFDMHAHMPQKEYQKEICRTLLDFGITTIRNPGGGIVATVELRNSLLAGEIEGPRMFTAGGLIDTPESVYGNAIKVETEEEIRSAVRQEAKKGVDYIKLYTSLTPELVKAAIDEAHSLDLEIIGHLGRTSWTFAANAGIDGLLHSAMAGPTWELIPVGKRDTFRNLASPTNTFDSNLFRGWRETFDINGAEMENLIRALVDNNVVVDPTLVMMEALIWGDDTEYRESLEPDFAPQPMCESWRSGLHPKTSWWSEEAFTEAKRTFPVFLNIILRFYNCGVFLTTGTDLMNPWITPGVSLHRELELLVEAGIEPLEVIKIATKNGAEALNILDVTGTIEEGKQADLIVLSDNPVENIKHTRNIEMVIKAGKIYKPVNH